MGRKYITRKREIRDTRDMVYKTTSYYVLPWSDCLPTEEDKEGWGQKEVFLHLDLTNKLVNKSFWPRGICVSDVNRNKTVKPL